MLKCTKCEKVIFPNLKYTEEEFKIIEWGLCSDCDYYDCTFEQKYRFKETLQNILSKEGIYMKVDIEERKPPRIHLKPNTNEQNDRFQEVDI
jgi:hypothetical protein